ncbi:MAG: hypothetical protein ACRERD_21770, partial [Candidatus Binatia bacterium]
MGLALVYVATGLTWLVVSVFILLALVMVSLVGPEARVRASTLAKQVRFSWRRWRIKRKLSKVMINAGLTKTDKTASGEFRHGGHKLLYPKLVKVTPTPMGVVAVFDGRKTGHGLDSFAPKAPTLCTGFGCLSLGMRPDPDRPYLTQVRMLYGDPFKHTISTVDLPKASSAEYIVVGFDEEGQPVEKAFWLSELIAGNLGSGKSSEVWRKLQGLLEHEIPFRVRVHDPKGGNEFFNLEDKAYRYSRTDFVKFLQEALNALSGRQAAMRAKGLRECPIGDPEFPLDVMIIDELITAIATIDKNARVIWEGKSMPADKGLLVFLSQIRTAGFIVIACVQVPQKELIGMCRDLFGYKTCLRVGSADIVRIMFPVDDATKRYPAHMIPADKAHAGIG